MKEVGLFRVCVCVCVYLLVAQSRPTVTAWTVAHQAPLSMEFSRQDYWSGLPCPSPSLFSISMTNTVNLRAHSVLAIMLNAFNTQCFKHLV